MYNVTCGQGQDYLDYNVSSIPDSLLKNAKAVKRFDHTKVTIYRHDKQIIEREEVVTVFDEDLSYYLDFYLHYNNDHDKIKSYSAIYLNAEGEKIFEVKKKEFSDHSANESFELVGNSRVLYYDYNRADFPLTVVKKYAYETENTCFLPTWQPLSNFQISVENSSIEIVNLTENRVQVKETLLEGPEYALRDSLYYEAKGLKAVTKEQFALPLSQLVGKVQFSPTSFNYAGHVGKAHNWKEYGAWINRALLQSDNKIDFDLLKKDVDLILDGEVEPRRIAEKLYKYLQEQTRYVSISIDDGGFKPMACMDVHKYKYGDCKALAHYMQKLLEVYEIPSNYIVVHAGEYPTSMDAAFYSHNQANHAIMNIPLEADTIWLDCTQHDAPFGFVGDFVDDRLVLEVNAHSSCMRRTPRYGADKNLNAIDGSCEISGDDITCSLDVKGVGIPYGFYKGLSNLQEEDLEKYLRAQIFKDLELSKIDSINFRFDTQMLTAKMHVDIQVKRYAEYLSDYLLLPLKFTALEVPKLKKDVNRTFPIFFARAKTTKQRIVYSYPSNYEIDKHIEQTKVHNSRFGVYECKIEVLDQNSVRVTRKFELKKGLYAASEYDEIRGFFRKILKEELTTLTFIKI